MWFRKRSKLAKYIKGLERKLNVFYLDRESTIPKRREYLYRCFFGVKDPKMEIPGGGIYVVNVQVEMTTITTLN